MSLWFLTKWYDLYWPPCWRVYSCLPPWRPKLLFAYISAKRCCKRYHITFSTFSLKFKCKICAQKEVINNLKKSHFRHVTSYKLTHFKKMVWVWKTKSLLFCLRYDPLIVFRMQNHITFIFIKAMSHDLLAQMAYYFGLIRSFWQTFLCIVVNCI